MITMKTYKIVGKTNPWIAKRGSIFRGKMTVVLDSFMTLKEAQKELLSMFNRDNEGVGKYAPNWGVATSVAQTMSCSPLIGEARRW